eukprot:scaffold101453_cov16-Tisochrysis_lutea.AAC.3
MLQGCAGSIMRLCEHGPQQQLAPARLSTYTLLQQLTEGAHALELENMCLQKRGPCVRLKEVPMCETGRHRCVFTRMQRDYQQE